MNRTSIVYSLEQPVFWCHLGNVDGIASRIVRFSPSMVTVSLFCCSSQRSFLDDEYYCVGSFQSFLYQSLQNYQPRFGRTRSDPPRARIHQRQQQSFKKQTLVQWYLENNQWSIRVAHIGASLCNNVVRSGCWRPRRCVRWLPLSRVIGRLLLLLPNSRKPMGLFRFARFFCSSVSSLAFVSV